MNKQSPPSNRADLIQRINRLSAPLPPLPTDMSPSIVPLQKIRCVIFDVYGTMLVSGSGDIGLGSGEDAAALADAMRAAGISQGGADSGRHGVELLRQQIDHVHEQKRASGVDFPEVEIRSIWRHVLDVLAREQGTDQTFTDQTIESLAVEYECRVNPVWPMPHLEQTLTRLQQSDLTLGIVSNSQFCTPLLFEALLGRSTDELGFDPNLCAWSYLAGCAKPSKHLYEPVDKALRSGSIDPNQVLYVGNDMRKDIGPANSIGWHTALFAGDQRSLRLETGQEQSNSGPSLTLTGLDQLCDAMGLNR